MKKLRQLRKELDEEIQFKVDVEGMPPTFMTGRSSAEILAKLRKIVKQPSMIKSVERQTDVEVRKAFRNKAQGREMEENYNWKVSHDGQDVHVKAPHAGAAVKKAQKGFGNKDLTKAKIKNLGKVGTPANEAVTYHGNPNKDDDARNAARRRRLAKQDNLLRKRAQDNEKARQALKDPDHNPAWANSKSKTEASVVPSPDGKSLVPMKKASEPKSKPVPNSQFGLPRLKKTNEATYGTQAQRMMSPLQKVRQDKEKADRDKDGKLHMMKGRPKKLGEISQDLKKRYTDKAKSDYGHQQFSADIAREMGAKDAEKYYRRKQRKRMAGITKASK